MSLSLSHFLGRRRNRSSFANRSRNSGFSSTIFAIIELILCSAISKLRHILFYLRVLEQLDSLMANIPEISICIPFHQIISRTYGDFDGGDARGKSSVSMSSQRVEVISQLFIVAFSSEMRMGYFRTHRICLQGGNTATTHSMSSRYLVPPSHSSWSVRNSMVTFPRFPETPMPTVEASQTEAISYNALRTMREGFIRDETII